MQNKQMFPFSKIVGQEKVKQALCIVAVNHKVGGLLLIGAKGTGKSVLVRSLDNVLPDAQLINVPLNISDDMLFGSIDMEYAVRYVEKRFSAGVLSRADGNLIYIDDINLFRQDLLRGILDTALSGYHHIEREGISYQHDCTYSVIGTMNPEEGTLSPQMLDKFGLSVAIETESDVEYRVQIMHHVLAYETDSSDFCAKEQGALLALQGRLAKAKELLPQVEVPEAMLQLAAVYCTKAYCAGHRAEFFLIETARTIAALAERLYILPQDVDDAAQFVLAHRVRQMNPESAPEDSESQDEETTEDTEQDQQEESTETDEQAENQQTPPLSQPDTEESSEPDNQPNEENESPETEQDQQEESQENDEQAPAQEDTASIDKTFAKLKMSVDFPMNKKVKRGAGKRSLTKTDLKQGRYVRATMPKAKVNDLAFDATIRAAAPYQRIREKTNCALHIKSEDIRQKVREKRIGNTFLFVVDASGSMGAKMRMKAVKGTIFTLLTDAYQKRDQVGMIAFRRNSAEVILPITRSVDLAQKCLEVLPTGGKTPLAEGLSTTLEVIQKLKRNEAEADPIVILLTDGRTNRDRSNDPVETALKLAEKFRQAKVKSVVIDTETDFIKLGIAKKIAQAMQATYYPLQQLSKQNILHIVQNCG